MRGGARKPRKGKPKETSSPTKAVQSATDAANSVSGNDLAESFSESTPKRSKMQKGGPPAACLTSTPTKRSSSCALPEFSASPPGATKPELRNPEVCTRSKTSQRYSLRCKSTPQSRDRSCNASHPARQRKKARKKPICSDAGDSRAKRGRGRLQNIPEENLKKESTTHSSQHSRPRFELKSDAGEKAEDSLVSSDLSIDLSDPEEKLLSLSVQEDEESPEEEEEELPSYLMQGDKEPPSITAGVFVWYKLKKYPFWPALVKSVNRKQGKASVLFIDNLKIHKKKGFTVTLKTLKPFDCKEANELVCKAKENYKADIEWSLELIKDYSVKIACGSFSGSFIEYFAHDMSYPVRRRYPQDNAERLTITRDLMKEVLDNSHMDDSLSEEEERVISSKRLLPDRSQAAYNRANEKLVHFIVKQHMADDRLLAVIRGEHQSRWLRAFLRANRARRVVNIYLDDDQQLDEVYRYLVDLCSSAGDSVYSLAELKFLERVPFVLDVLLPEAIICAIAGVDKISEQEAEEKYLKGRSVSDRERQEFEVVLDRLLREKSKLHIICKN